MQLSGSAYVVFRTGCALAGASTAVFDDPHLRRAKTAVEKRGGFEKRPRMFVRMGLLQSMAMVMATDPTWTTTVMWIFTAYAFLLRVPSECLPITVIDGAHSAGQTQAGIVVLEGCLELHLRRRTNLQAASSGGGSQSQISYDAYSMTNACMAAGTAGAPDAA